MAQTKTPPLSEELQQKLDDIAREQNREPAEVLEEAVRHYIRDRKWQQLVAKGERRARELGITEEDVPRIIEEYRQEKRTR